MDEAAQDGRENSQDEEAERTSQDVEDETVLCTLTALLHKRKSNSFSGMLAKHF